MDPKMLENLAADVKGVAARLDGLPTAEDVAKNREELAQQAAMASVISKDIEELKRVLKENLGPSGARDFEKAMGDFVKYVFHQKKNLRTPAWLEKAVADYTTDVDAQGGYLVPRLVADEIIKLTLAHGDIWPLVNKVTMPAGATMRYPYESTLASVAWRRTQGSAGTQVDPAVVWGADTLSPLWINGYVYIANEAMTAPGISIPQNLTMQLISQIIRKAEWGIIRGAAGTAGGTGFTSPHSGILTATSVNAQTNAATVTLALIDKFIGECIADDEGAANTGVYKLVTTDAVAHQLKSTLTQQGLDWGNVAAGQFPKLRGYDFITSPFVKKVNVSTERDHILLSPVGKVTVAWTGDFRVDFNDRAIGASSQGWVSNETALLVGTHIDFTIGNPAMHHEACFLALS